MGNMSYCRFENTCRDLNDCTVNLSNETSKREFKAAERLLRLCEEFIERWEETEGPTCDEYDED